MFSCMDSDEQALGALQDLARSRMLGESLMTLILQRDISNEGHAARELNARFRAILKDPNALRAARERVAGLSGNVWPEVYLKNHGFHLDELSAHQRFAIIGGGAAGLMLARYRKELGCPPECVTLFESGRLGGIWNNSDVTDGGHNTFAPLDICGLRLTGPSDGRDVQRFLGHIAKEIPASSVRPSRVEGVRYASERQTYFVSSGESEEEFDAVCLCTGIGEPISLDSGPMMTNAHRFADRLPIARSQKTIPAQDWERFHGTRPLIVGLGNSAMRMLQQFVQMQQADVDVQPTILTHFSREALEHPDQPLIPSPSGFPVSLFRSSAHLRGIQADVPGMEELYWHAYWHGWIRSGVQSWNVAEDTIGSGSLAADITYANGDHQQGSDRVDAIPEIFVLTGYRPPPDFLRKLDCDLDQNGCLVRDPHTGRVRASEEGFGSRLYALGGVARGNSSVLPGIISDAGKVIFADCIAAHARSRQRKIQQITRESTAHVPVM